MRSGAKSPSNAPRGGCVQTSTRSTSRTSAVTMLPRLLLLLVLLFTPALAHARGTVPIRADAHWLACTVKICVPEQGQLSLDLPIGAGAPNRAQFDEWRRALPRPLASLGHFEAAGDKLRVAIPLPASVRVAEPYL